MKANNDSTTFIPAHRGQLCLAQRSHRYSTMYSGAYHGYTDYTLCRVISITREGEAKEIEAGNDIILKRRDRDFIYLMPASFDADTALASLALGIVFDDISAARAALCPFVQAIPQAA